MFRATMWPSSGETTVSMRHLVLVILCGWLSVMQGGMNLFHPALQSSTQNNKYQVSHEHSCFSWWWSHSRPKHVEIGKYTKNKLCTMLALFTRLYRDARSTKHKNKRDKEIWNFGLSGFRYVCTMGICNSFQKYDGARPSGKVLENWYL